MARGGRPSRDETERSLRSRRVPRAPLGSRAVDKRKRAKKRIADARAAASGRVVEAKTSAADRVTGARAATSERVADAKAATEAFIAKQKPRLRGVSLEWAFFVSLIAGGALVAAAPTPRATLAGGIYATSLSALLGVSALYHPVEWRGA